VIFARCTLSLWEKDLEDVVWGNRYPCLNGYRREVEGKDADEFIANLVAYWGFFIENRNYEQGQ
jgi:hypothetical protein